MVRKTGTGDHRQFLYLIRIFYQMNATKNHENKLLSTHHWISKTHNITTSEKGKALTTPLPLSLPRVARRQLNARSASTLKSIFFIGAAANIAINCKSCGFFTGPLRTTLFHKAGLQQRWYRRLWRERSLLSLYYLLASSWSPLSSGTTIDLWHCNRVSTVVTMIFAAAPCAPSPSPCQLSSPLPSPSSSSPSPSSYLDVRASRARVRASRRRRRCKRACKKANIVEFFPTMVNESPAWPKW